MRQQLLTGIAAFALAFGTGAALADEEAELVINGEIEIVTKTAAPAHLDGALEEIMSGWRFRSDEPRRAPRASPAWIATARPRTWRA